MMSQTSYSIYVRFRGRRLALLKHIRSLDTARSALRALRADRFHDADQVFLVNDVTKQIVDEGERGDAPRAGLDSVREGSTHGADHLRAAAAHGVHHAADGALAGGEVGDGDGAPQPHSASDRPLSDAPPGSQSGVWRSGVGPEEPPITRLRRAMAEVRAARARHDAALQAVLRFQPNGVIDESAQLKLEASSRTASEMSARALEQIEHLLKLLERAS